MCKFHRFGFAVCAAVAVAGGLNAQTLGVIEGLNFGVIDIAASPPGGDVQMGPNGFITYGSNLDGSGTGVAGKVQLNGTTGQSVDIRCSSSATIARIGGDSIPVTPIKISFGTAQSYAAASDCAGGGVSVITATLAATASDNIAYLGGQLDVDGLSVHGVYESTLTNGLPITLTVIFN